MKKFSRTILFWVALILIGQWATISSAQSFTSKQAREGRDAYRAYCAVCHGANLEGEGISPPLSGQRFDYAWRGKSADVISFHIRRMPPEGAEGAGNINDETYANILAYIQRSNGFGAGKEALPTDLASLRDIDIPKKEGS